MCIESWLAGLIHRWAPPEHVCVFDLEPCYCGNVYSGLIIANAQGLPPLVVTSPVPFGHTVPMATRRQLIRAHGNMSSYQSRTQKPHLRCLIDGPCIVDHDLRSIEMPLAARWGRHERIDALVGP